MASLAMNPNENLGGPTQAFLFIDARSLVLLIFHVKQILLQD